MSSSDDYHKLKDQILSMRKQMIGTRSDDHWISLRPKFRRLLSEAVGKMSVQQISEVTGFDKETIERWIVQYRLVQNLRMQVQNLKQDKKNLSLTLHIRPQITALARLGSARSVSAETGVPKSTVIRWLEDGWDKIEVTDKDGKKPRLSIPALPEEAAPNNDQDAMDSDVETKQLAVFLERHNCLLYTSPSPRDSR